MPKRKDTEAENLHQTIAVRILIVACLVIVGYSVYMAYPIIGITLVVTSELAVALLAYLSYRLTPFFSHWL